MTGVVCTYGVWGRAAQSSSIRINQFIDVYFEIILV